MTSSAQHKTSDDLAVQYGVSLRSLSYFEELGLISPTVTGSRRYYTAKDCVRLELILKGKRLGFSLPEIGQLIDAHMTTLRA